MVSLLISIPHAGEWIPDEAFWLRELPESVQMCDVDRYVDELYQPALEHYSLPVVKAHCHRYVVDLNRLPDDFDQQAVEGAVRATGFSSGVHWVKTTQGHTLMARPISQELHQRLIKLYYEPFHAQLRAQVETLKRKGAHDIFHLDCHSMPSLGTSAHRDPGEVRAEVVVSDQLGRSSRREFVELVMSAYRQSGFQVALNWPYIGGRITEQYGQPKQGHHTVQVELRRDLYMDEVTKSRKSELMLDVRSRLKVAIGLIVDGLKHGLD